jgi:hypothetical protein
MYLSSLPQGFHTMKDIIEPSYSQREPGTKIRLYPVNFPQVDMCKERLLGIQCGSHILVEFSMLKVTITILQSRRPGYYQPIYVAF